MTEVDHEILFRDAVEARDLERVRASLAPDVRFYSPIPAEPFVGRDEVASILAIPAAVFGFHDTFRYTRTLVGSDNWYAIAFEAQLADGLLEGVDLLQLDDDGLVVELRVFMRPLAQIEAFAAAAYELLAQATAKAAPT
jgi:hypothetical protein